MDYNLLLSIHCFFYLFSILKKQDLMFGDGKGLSERFLKREK